MSSLAHYSFKKIPNLDLSQAINEGTYNVSDSWCFIDKLNSYILICTWINDYATAWNTIINNLGDIKGVYLGIIKN